MNIKNLILGEPLTNDAIKHEKLSKLWGLPIMASDAVSSVAYAIEEILLVLVPVLGLLAFNKVPFIVLGILVLMTILILSYSKIIDHYPSGGGSYAVAKENLGETASLLAASSLIIDYILTVAVSISSSTAALVSAFPLWGNYKILISLLCVAFITLINLRGVREASKILGLPTYLFIFSMTALIITGFFKLATGTLTPISYDTPIIPEGVVQGAGLFLILRAFSSGCSAMSGIEAVSNAVPSFKEPSTRNAKQVLYMLGAVIIFIFGGTSLLTMKLSVVPIEGHTALSQLSAAVFGHSIMYYILQAFTSLILILATNTAYNGLPQLLYILAHDGYVPRQFSHRGTKLSFSNGIIFIFIVASLLIVGFKSDTHKLIPLYSVGVFISFTIAQYGMFKKWRKTREPNWQYKCWINGFGAIVTTVVSIIVFISKFKDGAWILAIVMPILMLTMHAINNHYSYVAKQLKLDKFNPYYDKDKVGSTQCIILVNEINKSLLKTINYATSISTNIVALHICRHPEHAVALRREWDELEIPFELKIIETPYRDIIGPLDNYLWEREKQLKPGEGISVILVNFVSDHWYDYVLHNPTSFLINRCIMKHKNVTCIQVPFHYSLNNVPATPARKID